MPYVVRDQAGRIIKVTADRSDQATEALSPDDPALRAFLGLKDAGAELRDGLSASDLDLVRVLEDLVTVLIDKRVIALTDLPQAAQQKLADRFELRSRLADLGGIIEDSDSLLMP